MALVLVKGTMIVTGAGNWVYLELFMETALFLSCSYD